MEIKITKTDAYLIALFFVIAIPITMTGYNYSKGLFEPISDTIIYCTATWLVSYITVFKFFPKFFPKSQIIRLLVAVLILMTIVGSIELISYRLVIGKSLASFFANPIDFIFWAITTSAQNAGILIGILLGKKFYDAQLDIQKGEKEKRESELRLLKSQIDPHFLFNNLNTVDSLIDSNPKVAKEYLNKLSKLYRYLIHTKEDEVVPLEDELDFAKNYIFLMQTRFGNTYQFKINQNSNIENHLIPPGGLQTLLENVVKHNSGDSENAVECQIDIEKDKIVVRNNIRLKNGKTDSTGTGLNNLLARYALLTDKQVKIYEDKDYVVELPSIKSIS